MKSLSLSYTTIVSVALILSSLVVVFNPHDSHAHFLGGKFSHTKGKKKTLYWYYGGNHRYMGNAWQGGQNWRAGSARVRPERKTTDSGTVHIRLYDKTENNKTYWAITYNTMNTSTNLYTKSKIYFNPPRLDPEDDFTRTKVATHEFGHSFGLAHTPASKTYDSVMKQGRFAYNTPMPHDKSDINSLYD